MTYRTNRGIGVFIAILIVALVTVGGVAAVKVSKEKKMQKEMVETLSSAETKVNLTAKLGELKATLASTLGAQAKVDASLKIISDIKTLIGQASVKASAKAQAELHAIEHRIDELEAQLKTGSQTIADSVTDLMLDIRASVETGAEIEDMQSDVPTNAHAEGETSVENTDNMPEDHGDGEESNASVSGSVKIELE